MPGGMTFDKPLAQYRVLLILALLDDNKPRSSKEIAEAIGLHRSAVPAYLAHMGARVARWRRPGTGNLVPLYDMRPLPSVPRPRAKTTTEIKREVWQRLKADPVRHARVKALQTIRRRRVRNEWSGGITIFIDGNVNRR